MFILKLAGKILLLPVWLILFVIGLAVKMTAQTGMQPEPSHGNSMQSL